MYTNKEAIVLEIECKKLVKILEHYNQMNIII